MHSQKECCMPDYSSKKNGTFQMSPANSTQQMTQSLTCCMTELWTNRKMDINFLPILLLFIILEIYFQI